MTIGEAMAVGQDDHEPSVGLVTSLALQRGAAHLVARPGWLDERVAAFTRRHQAGAVVYLFVGERQSLRAAAGQATWYDGRFASRTLHEALAAIGIDPSSQLYTNLWRQPGRDAPPAGDPARTDLVRAGALAGLSVVALGTRVAAVLADAAVSCHAAPHPARQGPRRARACYVADLRAALGWPGGRNGAAHVGPRAR